MIINDFQTLVALSQYSNWRALSASNRISARVRSLGLKADRMEYQRLSYAFQIGNLDILFPDPMSVSLLARFLLVWGKKRRFYGIHRLLQNFGS